MEGQPNSFTERFAKSAEVRIEADKIKNTHDNAVDLVKNNVDFFGGFDEEKKSEVAVRVLSRFGRGYKSVQGIINDTNNSSKNQRIAHGDFDSLAESVQIAMDMSVLGEDLVTDSMTAEQIDENLPIEMSGIGKRIKEKRLLDSVKITLVEKNNVIENGNLFTTQDKVARSEIYEKWGEEVKKLPENNYVRKYVEVGRSVLKEMGVEAELTPKQGVYVDKRQDNKGSKEGEKNIYIPNPYVTDRDTGEVSGGMSRYDVPPEKVAEAFLFMDSALHWDSYRNTQWFKDLSATEEGKKQQARIEYMVMVNNGASNMIWAGKDLDKITGNKMYFAFDNDKFTKLFDKDFKLVASKMLHDLCDEPYKDKNGIMYTRYKEEGDDINDKVKEHLYKIRDYKGELADFLAKQDNRFKVYTTDDDKGHKKGEFILNDKNEKIPDVNYMDQMNAYTAWNLWFMMGDSSLADRRRSLPTLGGIICDGVRTLNPEYKALNKWKVSEEDLVGAEWFGANWGIYTQTVMGIEEEIGPIDGNKTLKQKMRDKTMPLLANKTCYGFFDFTSGGRDLYDKDGNLFYDKKIKKNLSTLLWDYADFNDKGECVKVNEEKDFNFGESQVDFLNHYRDQQEAAVVVSNCIMGKEDVRDIDKFVSKIKTAFGMVDGIKVNGERPFEEYTHDPKMWVSILGGSFGIDMQALSTDHIRLKNTNGRAYSMFIQGFLTTTLKLRDKDVNLRELMKELGVSLKPGEQPNFAKASIRNQFELRNEENRTVRLLNKIRNKF